MKRLPFMKKYILGAAVVMGMGLLTACGGNGNSTEAENNVSVEDNTAGDTAENTAEETADFDVQELADKLKDEGSFKDQLAELDTEVGVEKLYGLNAEDVESAAFYTNTNATAEEIAVIKVSSEDKLQAVIDAFNQRVADQKEACENYLPDEMPKLEAAVIKSSGCYAVLCVSEDSDQAESIIGAYIK